METKQPVVRARSEHNISRRDIDPDALKVLYRLVRRGHVAYLVGGGVRDLLLGRQPKDFDVSTDARPNDLKRLFRNCFLIGRRFRLAHIKYGEKVIETSTFRCQPENHEGEDLLQLEDNTFGTPEQDARRRDFTINGLFYDVESFSVLDYVGGLDDLEKRVIRSIGDASIRFREDPVRMIRAIRFASRLGFAIEDQTFHALLDCREEIRKASLPRLLEELYRLYAFGAANRAFRLLRQTRVMEVMLPEVSAYLDATDANGDSPLWNYLEALDRGDLVVPQTTNALMLGALFLPMVLHAADKPDSALTQKILSDAYDAVVGPVVERLRVPRRVQDTLMRILTAQHRFFSKPRKGFSKAKFAAQDCFPEALALYELHLTATGKDFARADEWRVLWESVMDEREGQPAALSPETPEDGPRRESRRRRRRRRRDHPADGASLTDGADAADELDTEEPMPVEQVAPVASGRVSLVSPAAHAVPGEATGADQLDAGDEEEAEEAQGNAGGGDSAAEAGQAQGAEGGDGERLTRSKRRRRRRKKRSGGQGEAAPNDGAPAAGVDAAGEPHTDRQEIPSGGPLLPERPETRKAAGVDRERESRMRREGQDSRSVREEAAQTEAPASDEATDAPLTAFNMIKQVKKGARDRKKHGRRGDKDKQIIHDYRPSDAGPSFDKGSEAPHWLDEI